MVRSASYQKPIAGPSVIHIEGTEPGVLDKTQRSRLLRRHNSTLSFASFDPYAATPRDPDISKLSLDEEKCRPKRIVIENVPGHGSSWRWVPSARKQEGVDDEGSFPRLIELCGQLCVCSQDQWDIYKLDPLYDCYVKFPPALTVIMTKGSVQFTTPLPQMAAQGNLFDEGYDSEQMSVDGESTKPQTRFRKRRPSPREPLRFDFAQTTPSPPEPGPQEELKTKRRADESFQSLRSAEEEEYDYFAEDIQNRNTKLYEPKHQKRARTTSPDFGKRVVNALRVKREAMKKTRMKQEAEARKELRDHQILREVLSNTEQGSANFNGNSEREGAPNSDAETEDDMHDEHEDLIATSLRRMDELNKNRATERDRERQLGVQEAVRLNAQPNHTDVADAERRRLAKKVEEEKLRQEEDERQARQRAEILAKVERERQLRHDQWNNGPWSVARAIERYKITSVFFDKTNFSEDRFPLAFIDVPWPSLRHPSQNRPQDIDWQSTNEFFDSLKPYLRDQAYKSFLKQSLQRFHPDRWSGRNLFAAILDDDERNEIDTAINTVSKALGALYAETRSS